jgi:sporulation protein YlmC with PRC-barrel domain
MSLRHLGGERIRFSELLRMRVFDVDGKEIGEVSDARFIRDGPVQGAFGPGYRLQGLVVGKGSFGVRLGFDRASVKGPWLLKKMFRKLHADTKFVDWSHIDAIEEEEIRLKVSAGDLQPVESLPG